MNLKDIIALLPESSRVEAEKVLAEAVKSANPIADIDSNEKAAAFIESNRFFKGARDADISVRIAKHDETFMKDKFPKLLETEIKKLTGPETDPIKLELAQIKAEREAEKAELKREKLTVAALKIAEQEKIPAKYIHRFLEDDEEKTIGMVKEFAAEIKGWRDTQIETTLKEKLGNVGKPTGGNTTPPADLKTRYEAALKDPKRLDEALVLKEQMIEAAKNGL